MTTYEHFDNDSPTPSTLTDKIEKNNRCAYCLLVSLLTSVVLNLIMVIVFYITFIKSVRAISDSPLLKKLEHLDLQGLVNVLNSIEIEKVQRFINSVINLGDQVNTEQIVHFAKALDECVTDVCSSGYT